MLAVLVWFNGTRRTEKDVLSSLSSSCAFDQKGGLVSRFDTFASDFMFNMAIEGQSGTGEAT